MWQKCPICNGSGKIHDTLSSSSSGICSVCNGTKIISELTGLPPVKKDTVKAGSTTIITYEELQKLKP